MNDFVIHQPVTLLTPVSKGIAHQEDSTLQHPPKFSVGDEVVWAYMEAHDYGVVVDRVWTTRTVHTVTGWHYLVRLHRNSFSYFFCKQDWAYEQDLQLLEKFQLLEGKSLE
ncbi:MAG: hypothetical protein AB1589_25080 [Cyanobacteriota bacterium]